MEHALNALIAEKLVERGKALLGAPKPNTIQFTRVPDADALLSDLDVHPHAFVLACLMNRQMSGEKAWLIPYLLSQKLGGFQIETLSELSLADIRDKMSNPPLHRFANMISNYFHLAVQRIADQYAKEAHRIWMGKPPSAEVVYRFLEFDGIGPKIATMAANILVRDFKIPFADYFSIDVSADVHVRRVFARLGLCAPDPTAEQVIYKARSLHPEFPGLMDSPCWEIGRNWCKAPCPECHGCYMNDLCPTPHVENTHGSAQGISGT